MSTSEENAKTVQRYLEFAVQGRVDDVVDLYADDANVEDPVGGEVHIGRQAIHGFYTAMTGGFTNAGYDVMTLRALGNETAFHWQLTVGGAMRIDIISVMTFNEDGKIASMKAYWGPDNITQL